MPVVVGSGTGRSNYGGGSADVVFVPLPVFNVQVAALPDDSTPVTFWDSPEGGTQHTDLLDANGNPVTSIPASAGWLPAFQGPSGVTEMWADAGSTRRLIQSRDQAAAAAASAASAASSAAAAESVGTTNDTIMASVASDSASAFRAALTNLYLPGGLAGVMIDAWNDYTGTDAARLQAACDDADANGKIVSLASRGAWSLGSTTIAAPRKAAMIGAGMGATTLTYTGTGAAITMYAPATAEKKQYVHFAGFTLVAASASTGINAKGMTYGTLNRVEVQGVADNASITTGTVGVLIDGSYGGSIGAWHNSITDSYVHGWDTDIKLTGVSGSGQANENYIERTRCGWHNTGIDIDCGDHVTVRGCDLSCNNPTATGVRVNDVVARVIDNRFEQVGTAVHVTTSAGATIIEGNNFANVPSSGTGVAVKMDGNQRTRIGPNYYSTSVIKWQDAGAVTSATTTTSFAGVNGISQLNWTAFTFVLPSVAASLSGAALNIPGVTGNQHFNGRPYQVRGIAGRLASSITAGSVTITPAISGTASTTLSATATTGKTIGGAFQAMGNDVNAGTSSCGAQITTSADFAPNGSGQDVEVVVFIEFTD